MELIVTEVMRLLKLWSLFSFYPGTYLSLCETLCLKWNVFLMQDFAFAEVTVPLG